MRFYLLAVTAWLHIATLVQADHSDDTLRYYLSKTDACIVGTIASEPIGESTEGGLVHYHFDFEVSEVLAGDSGLKERRIWINVLRAETADADKHPDLKEGAKCILFLKDRKPGGREVAPWETVDFWFGFQRDNSAMARALRRLGAEEPKRTKADTAVPARKEAPKKGLLPSDLEGRFELTLPAGFKYQVMLRPSEANRLVLEKAVRFSGVYELRDSRLVMVKPTDAREEGGFQWEIDGRDELTLIAQSAKISGSRYLGATLKRLKKDDSKDAADTKPAPKATKDDTPPSEGASEEEKKAAEALKGIKTEYRLRKEPTYRAKVQYCMLLLGKEAKTRLWLASDGRTLYVDRNGNGDLTDADEAIPYKNGFAALMADAFPGHGGDDKHTNLHIAVRQRDWEKNTGGYWALRADVGSTFHMYAMVHKFAQKPEEAPIVHLGGPLRMGLNDLPGGEFVRGRPVELEAYVACHYPGVERAYVDVDRRCPTDVHPMAEILLPQAGAAEPLALRVPLTKRC